MFRGEKPCQEYRESLQSAAIGERHSEFVRVEGTRRSAKWPISAAAKLKLEASSIEVSGGMVQLNSGVCKATGVVQCDTLIANSVVSQNYTPGVGNVW